MEIAAIPSLRQVNTLVLTGWIMVHLTASEMHASVYCTVADGWAAGIRCLLHCSVSRKILEQISTLER